MNIVVLYSTPTQRAKNHPFIETENDTQESALEVADALQANGAQVRTLALREDTIESVGSIQADLVFNLIEWTGLDLPLAIRAISILEQSNIPFTGATSLQYQQTTDKIILKRLLDEHKLPTAPWQAFVHGDEPVRPDLPFPVLVKPSVEHCSIGIGADSIARDQDSLKRIVATYIHRFEQPVYAEQFLSGRELQVTVYEENEKIIVLPPAQITYDHPTSFNLLSYESRWNEDDAEFKQSHVVLAALPPTLREKIISICTQTFQSLAFRDYMRVDMRFSGETPYILEANSNPGLGDSDEYGMTISYKAAGMTFADFIWKIVQSAERRNLR